MDRVSAAQYAQMVMYAWDMCDLNLRQMPPQPDARIGAAGWTILGYISASDTIARTGPSIRTSVLGASDSEQDRVTYGYVAIRDGECVVAIRGTDGAEEWADDFDFYMVKHPTPGVGLVDQGFFGIYSSMCFHDINGNRSQTGVVAGIAACAEAAGANSLMVLGHSLGSTLAAYLVLDLNLAGHLASACMFASPKTGNSQFVAFFEDNVANYDVFNYERDIVPTVPPADVLHFSAYHQLMQAKTIPVTGAEAAINDNPLCNHHLICYTALLDPRTYRDAINSTALTTDDKNCAKCVTAINS